MDANGGYVRLAHHIGGGGRGPGWDDISQAYGIMDERKVNSYRPAAVSVPARRVWWAMVQGENADGHRPDPSDVCSVNRRHSVELWNDSGPCQSRQAERRVVATTARPPHSQS